jgi:hypothetical protein
LNFFPRSQVALGNDNGRQALLGGKVFKTALGKDKKG